MRYLLTRALARKSPTLALGNTGCISLDDVAPAALPGEHWVRVDTTLSGICGSDLSAVTAHDSFTLEPFGAYPFTFGHENIGVISEIGAGVSEWSIGQRVIVNPMLACEQRAIDPPCDPCARGEYGLCRNTRVGAVGGGPMTGYCPRVGGGWSKSFVAHESQLHNAGTLSDDVAVLTDPFVSALRPVLLHPPAEDETVLVIGAGTIGALTIKALRATGFNGTITTLARYPFQRDLALRAGATHVFRDRAQVFKWAAALPGAKTYKPTLAPGFVEGGPALVYDTVGSESSLNDALSLTREGGRIVLIGAAAKATTDWTRVWYRQLTLTGVFAYGKAPFNGAQTDIYAAAISIMRRGGFDELQMVTHRFPIEAYRSALATALDKSGKGSIKVVFTP